MMRALAAVLLFGCSSPMDHVPQPDGPVTVRVMRGTDPIALARVVFSGRAGNLIEVRATDADGRVTGSIEDGGSVTAIDPDDTRRLFTITEMRPNDFVELPLEVSPVAMKAPVGTLAIAAPPGALPAGTDHVHVETPCGDFDAPSLPATFGISADCGTEVPVIVTAATPLGDLEHPGHGLAFVAGIAKNGALAPGAWSTSCTKVDAFVADRMQLTFYPRLGGHTFKSFPDFCTVGAPAPGSTYAYGVYDFGEGAVTTSFGYAAGGSLRWTNLVRNFDTLPSHVDVGRDPDLLVGDVRALAMDAGGAEWSRDGALGDADAIIAKLTYIFAGNDFVTWKLVVAGDATSVALPEVPNITVRDTQSRELELHYYDASWLHAGEVPAKAFLDAYMPDMPTGENVRQYTEQFFLDVK